MKKAIYIIGPSSTGKTTLCDALVKRLGLESAAYVREVARQVMLEKGYSRDTIANPQMQSDIMEAHLKEEKKALEASNLVVCDRAAVDAVVYGILTSTSVHEANTRKAKLIESGGFQEALARYRGAESIIVLLSPVEDWVVDDGVRSMEQQGECRDIFEKLLEELGIPYSTLGADCRSLPERVDLVMGFARL